MATFVERVFDFQEGEAVLEHTDAWPSDEDVIDPTKYHLECFHPLDGDRNYLAINIDDYRVAIMLMRAARRQIDRMWNPNTVVALRPEDFKQSVYLLTPREQSQAQSTFD